MFHNPACSTSRNALALIRNSGVEPVVIEYLKKPPDRAKLVELVAAMGVPVRDVLRQKGTPYDELKLDDPKWNDDQLIDFMVSHPILMNRPIIVTPLGTSRCRPSEAALSGSTTPLGSTACKRQFSGNPFEWTGGGGSRPGSTINAALWSGRRWAGWAA